MARQAAFLVVLLALGSVANAQQRCFPITWRSLAKSGQRFGAANWGALVGQSGKQIVDVPKAVANYRTPSSGLRLSGAISAAPDYPTFHTVGGRTFVVNHFENPLPSSLYISELAAPDASGHLRIVSTRPVPDSDVEGVWHLRAGTKTPWGTHLGSEEYPLDCRVYDQLFVPCRVGPEAVRTFCGMAKDKSSVQSLGEFARYFGYYAGVSDRSLAGVDILANQAAHDAFVRRFKCYNYGASPEVRVLPGGATRVTKLRTLGRLSHEMSIVLPDNKTVYISDSMPNSAFLRFVADRPNDLSSGVLSAARFAKQRSDAAGRPLWDVSWVQLGRGNQAELDRLARSGLKFGDIFEVSAPAGSPPRCPAGFQSTNHPSLFFMVTDPKTYSQYHMECLKVKPGMDTAAAFLEPRRLAAMRGGTTEFEQLEGLAWSPRFRQLYIADGRLSKGLTDDTQFNHGGTNAIRLRPNPCGALFAIDVDGAFNGYQARLVMGADAAPTAPGGEVQCSANNVADPEKTEYVAGNLIIQENINGEAVMWAFDLETNQLIKIFRGPRGTELTGVGLNTVGNKAYLTFTIQRPDGPATLTTAGIDGQMGYIGPLPLDIAGDKFTAKFAAAPATAGPDGITVSPQVCLVPAAPRKAPGQRR